MTETQHLKQKIKLARALGLIQGCLNIEDMEDYDKAGLIQTLEEVRNILTKEIEVENDE